MNYRMIFSILGKTLLAEAALMGLPLIVSFVYGEGLWYCFVIPMIALLIVGALLLLLKPKNKNIYAREGFVVVSMTWVVLSLFGALPFFISQQIPNYIDCLFETVSGFTTTGASILTDVEAISRSLLFWRSFTQWIGGMGVLVFVMAILPLAGAGRSMHLMRAEIPGPKVGRLVSKIGDTAKILYGIYIGLTLLQIILLLFGGMTFYDACVHAFGTAGTGGFSITNNSLAAYDNGYIHTVIGIFMLLFGTNFAVFYFLLIRQFKALLKVEEVFWYYGMVAISVVAIALNTLPMYANALESFHQAFFHVSSIVTTTSYTLTDINDLPTLSKTILLILMFIGGCAGSTSGGFKVARVVILFKTARRNVKRLLHPHAISSVKFNGKTLDEPSINMVQGYLIVYLGVFCVSLLAISFERFGLVTSVTSVISSLNNTGLGLELIGPAGNFAQFSYFGKIVLAIDMLLGRLEIFPFLVLLSPSVWTRRRMPKRIRSHYDEDLMES